MSTNLIYRKELEFGRFLAGMVDRIPRWVVAAVFSTAFIWEVFWYA